MELDELRQHLSHADPPDRVRAAWEIAMRLGGGAAPELRTRFDHEPSAGARRHLVVVLAGLGERDVVRVIAEHDPDAHVRATAVTMIARTSTDPIARDAWLAMRLSDATEVIAAVLDASDAPSTQLEASIQSLLDRDVREVRERALAFVEARETVLPDVVFRRAADEPDETLRERFAILALSRAPERVPPLDAATVRRIWNHRVSAPWHVLTRFVRERDADRLLDHLLWEEIPLSILLDLLVTRPWIARSASVDPVIARCESSTLTEEDRARLGLLASELEQSTRPVPTEAPVYDEDDDDFDYDPVMAAQLREERIARYARLINLLRGRPE